MRELRSILFIYTNFTPIPPNLILQKTAQEVPVMLLKWHHISCPVKSSNKLLVSFGSDTYKIQNTTIFFQTEALFSVLLVR